MKIKAIFYGKEIATVASKTFPAAPYTLNRERERKREEGRETET